LSIVVFFIINFSCLDMFLFLKNFCSMQQNVLLAIFVTYVLLSDIGLENCSCLECDTVSMAE
jgi:hypothetical protein